MTVWFIKLWDAIVTELRTKFIILYALIKLLQINKIPTLKRYLLCFVLKNSVGNYIQQNSI